MPNLDLIREWRAVQGSEQYAKADPKTRAAALEAFLGSSLEANTYSMDDLREFGQAKLDAIRNPEQEKLGFFKSVGEGSSLANEAQAVSTLSDDDRRRYLLDSYVQDTVVGAPQPGIVGGLIGQLLGSVDEAAQGATVGMPTGAAIGTAAGGVGAVPGAVAGTAIGGVAGFMSGNKDAAYGLALKENFYRLLDQGLTPEEAYPRADKAAQITRLISVAADSINPATKGASALARIGKEAVQNAGINTGAAIADVAQTKASGIEIGTEEAIRRVGFEAAGGLAVGAGFQGIRELGAKAVGPRPQPGDQAVPATDTQQTVVPPVEPPTVEPRGTTPEPPATTPETPGAMPPDVATPQTPEGSVVPETTSQTGSETPNFQGEAQSAPVSAPAISLGDGVTANQVPTADPNRIIFEVGSGRVQARFDYVKDGNGVWRPTPGSGIEIFDKRLRGKGLGEKFTREFADSIGPVASTGLSESEGTARDALKMWKRIGAPIEDLPNTDPSIGERRAFVLRGKSSNIRQQGELATPEGQMGDILAPDAGRTGEQKERRSPLRMGQKDEVVEEMRQSNPVTRLYNAQNSEEIANAVGSLSDDQLATVRASGEDLVKDLRIAVDAETVVRAKQKYESIQDLDEKAAYRATYDKALETYVKSVTGVAQMLNQAKRLVRDPEVLVQVSLDMQRKRLGEDFDVAPKDRDVLVQTADADMKAAKSLDEANADYRRTLEDQKELRDLEDELGGPDIPIEKAKKILSKDSDGTAAVEAEAMPIWDRYKEAAAKRLSFAFGDGKPKAKPSLERFTQDAGSAIQESLTIEKAKNPKVDRNVPKFKDLLENPEKHREIIQTALDNLGDTKLSAAAKEAAREQLEELLDAADFEGTVGAKVSGKILADRLRTTKLPVRKMMQAGMSDDQLRIGLVNDVMGSLGEMTPGAKRKAERIIGNTVDSFLKDLRQKLADAKAKADARKAAAKPKDKRPDAEQVLTPLWEQYKDALGKQIADQFEPRGAGKAPSLAQFSGQAKRAITDSLDIPKGPKAADKTIPTLKDIFENPGKHRQILERAREKVTDSKLSDRAKRKALESIDNLLQAGRPLAEQIAESPALKLVQKTIRESKMPLRQMLADGVTDDQMRDIIMRNVRDQLGDMDEAAQQRLLTVVEGQTDAFLKQLRKKLNAKQISKELRQKFQLRERIQQADDVRGLSLAEQMRFFERASRPEPPDDIAELRKMLAQRRKIVANEIKEKIERLSQAEADAIDENFRFHKKLGEVSGRGFWETALAMYQGNLLTTKSLGYNLVGNAVFIPARTFADAVAAPIDALFMRRVSGQGRSMIAPSLADSVVATRTAFTKGLGEAKTILFQGRRPNELLKGENMQGFAPVTAMAQLVMGVAGKENVVNMLKGTRFESFFRDTFELPKVDGKIPKNLLAAKALESIGYLPEAFFRTLAATDAIFKTGAEAFELSRQARMRGFKPGSEEYLRFLAIPPEGILKKAQERGLRSTFQQDNQVTRVAQQLLDAVPAMVSDLPGAESLARFLIRTQAPFVKTPINVIGETISYFPPVAALQFTKHLAKTRKLVGQMDKLMSQGLGKNDPEVVALKNQIEDAQAAGARAVGQLVAGVVAWMAADYLYEKGVISAGDRDDSGKERNVNTPVMPRYNVNLSALERLASGDRDTKVRPEDVLVGYEKLGVLGTLFASRTDLHKKYRDNPPTENAAVKQMSDAWWAVMGAFQFSLDSSFLMNTAGLLDALRGRGSERYITNLAAGISHIIVPNSYSRVTTANLPYRPDLDGGKGTTLGEYMENSLRMKLGMAQAIPAEIGPWGDPLPMTPEGSSPLVRALIDPFNAQGSTTDTKNHVLRRIFDATLNSAVYPSIPGGTSGVVSYKGVQVPLPNNLLSEYRATVGRTRKQTVERLLRSSLFQGENYNAMVKVLQRQYDAGLERGTKMFIYQNREQLEVLRQKVKDEEDRKKLRLGLQ